MVPPIVLSVFVVAAAALWLVVTRRRVREVSAFRDQLVAKYESMVTGELEEGEHVFKLRAVREIEIGRSTEDIAAQNGVPSASPDLVVGEHATFELEGGGAVDLAPGAKLTVRALANARRRVIDHTTRPGGMTSTVTFEVPANTAFQLHARWAGTAHASYRDREARRLDAPAGGYWLSDRSLTAADVPVEGFGLWAFLGMVGVGVAICAALLSCLTEFLDVDVALSIGAAVVGMILVAGVWLQTPSRGELGVQAGARWRPIAPKEERRLRG